MDEDSFTGRFSLITCLSIGLGFLFFLQPVNGSAGERAVKTDTPPPKVRGTPPVSQPQRELMIPRAFRKKSALFHPIILKAATLHEVDPALIKAVIMVESRYDPRAVSRQGAKGLMQLMPRTARALGVEDVFDPEHNVNGGVKYLRQLLDEFNHDLELALAAYNAGSSKVRRYRGVPPIKATRRYVTKVFEYYRYYKTLPVKKADDV
ncbi:MAG: lytic transglycosylase domain-containing protein [Deltaproteobacteria bacterium]|nr:lytic transglycosylase domain-containing protein [Deltaproteobacteria bacterium]MBW2048193.1 lytic transglycosylase domain-containing protein [Deltaproteobacteria bacterium]MBW2110571.1 lytic transglycosylase domain-containing protein [Deltaproteobacteria bacterium]MBW2352136.1 lytic transglycosylase domain-containing protein [Deltaproteobacteria bacterium]HDZ90424.1 lytic transglycosylase domain-containing protein [Deltaproteobacteria bacterium]